MRIVISSGHGLYVRGASSPMIDEVDEARRVTELLAKHLRMRGALVATFHDDTSVDQSTNLETIVDAHNSFDRDIDLSIHFNASEQTAEPMGCEVLWVTQEELAAQLSAAIAKVGFKDRGAKYRDDLFVLNNCTAPTVLLEICFVDSEADAEIYYASINKICRNLAIALTDSELPILPERPKPPRPRRPQNHWHWPRPEPPQDALFHAIGKCSFFGGPDDFGVDSDEGLAFFSDEEEAPHLFLAVQPEGTSGLARRLNIQVPYLACRFDYDVTPKSMLSGTTRALVRSVKTGHAVLAFCADWGPHEDTDRICDLSPAVMELLDLDTDDEVEVIYPGE